MMNFKKLYDTKLKKAVLIGAGIAAIAGTYGGTEGFTPFYNKKVGTSYGINIGGGNGFIPDSKFYGINLSGLAPPNNIGTVNGLNLSFLFNNCKTINGLNLGLANLTLESREKLNGLEIGLINMPITGNDPLKIVNGLQIGLKNEAKAGNVVQLGVLNSIEKENGKVKRSLLLNYHFKGRSKK